MGETKWKQAKCPKGKHLNGSSDTDVNCQDCPHDTYIDEENHLNKCLPCRECSSLYNFMTELDCKPDRNRQCKCKPGYYCNNEEHCHQCNPISSCPAGKGVTRQHTHLTDTVCSPCPDGTYSKVDDYISSCKNHTSCDSLGRDIKVPGTPKTDAECGEFKACKSCNWMLPAGLWAGLVVTALIIFLALFIMSWRTKRRSKKSNIFSEYISSSSPTLPPDILKYPAVCGVEKHEEGHTLTHTVENMDCITKCDLESMRVSEMYTTANECSDSMLFHSTCRSEPQETEWHD